MSFKCANLYIRYIVVVLSLYLLLAPTFAQDTTPYVSISAYSEYLSTNKDSVIIHASVMDSNTRKTLLGVKVEVLSMNDSINTKPYIIYADSTGLCKTVMPTDSYYLTFSHTPYNFTIPNVKVLDPDAHDIHYGEGTIVSYERRKKVITKRMQAKIDATAKKEAKAEAKRERRLKRQNK